MLNIQFKLNVRNNALKSKELFTNLVKLVVFTLLILSLSIIVDTAINFKYLINISLDNKIVLIFVSVALLIIIFSISIFFINLITKNYFITRNYLLIWIMLGIFAIYIGLLIYRIILIHNTLINTNRILNNLNYEQPWHNPNQNGEINYFLKQKHNAVILFYESIIFTIIFGFCYILIFYFTNKLYQNANLLFYSNKMTDYNINWYKSTKKNPNSLLNAPATEKQKILLKKLKISFDPEITLEQAKSLISSKLKELNKKI